MQSEAPKTESQDTHALLHALEERLVRQNSELQTCMARVDGFRREVKHKFASQGKAVTEMQADVDHMCETAPDSRGRHDSNRVCACAWAQTWLCSPHGVGFPEMLYAANEECSGPALGQVAF